MDWGRVDDLWSFFYVLTEMALPVPWKKIDDRDTMYRLKMEYQIGKKLCEGFPKQFQMISDYLESLGFADEPNYDLIIDLLGEMACDHECSDTPFDEEISFVDICPFNFEEPDFNIEGNWSEDSQLIHDESQNTPQSVQEESKNASQLAQEESHDSHPESCCLIF